MDNDAPETGTFTETENPWTEQYCQWFALCTNRAEGNVLHPVLDLVPTCRRCADKAGQHLL